MIIEAMKTMNSTSPKRNIYRVLPIMFVIIGLAGCADEADRDVPGMDTTALPIDTTGTTIGSMDASQGDTVQVSLVDFEIDMPMTLPAGSTVFEVTNDGTSEHNFEVEGQGMEEVFPQNVTAGETRTMQVDLQPGTYTVYCPVDDHRSQGMEVTLTVEEDEGGTPDF